MCPYCYYSHNCNKFHLLILQSELSLQYFSLQSFQIIYALIEVILGAWIFVRSGVISISENIRNICLAFSKSMRNLTDVRQTFATVDLSTCYIELLLPVACNAFVKLQSDRSRICRTLCTVTKERQDERRKKENKRGNLPVDLINLPDLFRASFFRLFSAHGAATIARLSTRAAPVKEKRSSVKVFFECVLPRHH